MNAWRATELSLAGSRLGFGWACMRFGYHEVHACVLTTVLGKEAKGQVRLALPSRVGPSLSS